MILVVRRIYGQEAAMGQSLIYQIYVLSAKFSFCPNVSVLMCLCVDQASYLADSEMWRPQLLSYLGQWFPCGWSRHQGTYSAGTPGTT